VIERAKSVLEKLEKYELAVFADESKNGIQKAAGMKAAAQVSLFAIANENVLDELRTIDVSTLSADDAKRLLVDAKKRLI
jgi:DNA mismatch repair ATPase MutS